MLQRNGNMAALDLDLRRDRVPREDRDALLEAKDQLIAELEEQVAFLREELKRKDAILSRMVENVGESPVRASRAADVPRVASPGETRESVRAPAVQQEKPTLPKGYRVVATASDAWVLISVRGVRIARYRGELDLRKAVLDAHEHSQRQQ